MPERRYQILKGNKPAIARTDQEAYEFGYIDGKAGTFEHAGRCNVTQRSAYDKGHKAGEAERKKNG